MRALSQRAALALLLGFPLVAPLTGVGISPARADYTYGYSKVEQQFINQDNGGSGSGSGKGDSILDSTNPIDLMNKLRRGAAMEEATPPKDSIDAALQELEQLSRPKTASTAGLKASPGADPTLTPPAPVAPLPATLVKP